MSVMPLPQKVVKYCQIIFHTDSAARFSKFLRLKDLLKSLNLDMMPQKIVKTLSSAKRHIIVIKLIR